MASPFPGMDPYFEGELWASFHTNPFRPFLFLCFQGTRMSF